MSSGDDLERHDSTSRPRGFVFVRTKFNRSLDKYKLRIRADRARKKKPHPDNKLFAVRLYRQYFDAHLCGPQLMGTFSLVSSFRILKFEKNEPRLIIFRLNAHDWRKRRRSTHESFSLTMPLEPIECGSFWSKKIFFLSPNWRRKRWIYVLNFVESVFRELSSRKIPNCTRLRIWQYKSRGIFSEPFSPIENLL